MASISDTTPIRSLPELRAYCGAKSGTREDFPFGPDTLVFKVAGKMFALAGMNGEPLSVSLKCDPELAELLREKYDAVVPGYHLNKRHWNSIRLDGSVPDGELRELIDHSYELVVTRLPRREREALERG